MTTQPTRFDSPWESPADESISRISYQWVRDAEDGQLVARWIFEREIKAASEDADYTQAA